MLKSLSELCYFTRKTSVNKNFVLFKISKGRYFILGGCANITFRLLSVLSKKCSFATLVIMWQTL